MQGFAKKIDELIESGWSCGDDNAYSAWTSRVKAFLASSLHEGAGKDFEDLQGSSVFSHWRRYREQQIGHLEGLALKIEANDSPGKSRSQQSPPLPPQTATKKVFVVHGHDNEAKESVARFVERVGLEPIILHEQPNSGRTIIEKFEVFSDVGFAVVLLTPDDLGRSSSNSDAKLQERARQNVILELGYFMGKLTRKKVCALFKAGVEIPSDYQGILYVELDKSGAWKMKLAQELIEAGYSINVEALLRG